MRREITPAQIEQITAIYEAFAEGEHSKIFSTRDFGYCMIAVERPLRLNFQASVERIARVSEQNGSLKRTGAEVCRRQRRGGGQGPTARERRSDQGRDDHGRQHVLAAHAWAWTIATACDGCDRPRRGDGVHRGVQRQ